MQLEAVMNVSIFRNRSNIPLSPTQNQHPSPIATHTLPLTTSITHIDQAKVYRFHLHYTTLNHNIHNIPWIPITTNVFIALYSLLLSPTSVLITIDHPNLNSSPVRLQGIAIPLPTVPIEWKSVKIKMESSTEIKNLKDLQLKEGLLILQLRVLPIKGWWLWVNFL